VGLAAAVFQSLSLVVFCGSWRRRRRWRLRSGAVGFSASRWVGGVVVLCVAVGACGFKGYKGGLA